ncbi:MAG: hypothetical protein QNJ22_11555 [Desulfosarcinaceae bacterium]|nr:hypothetical protein [Desulfosarcinaceae bacterium]
MRPDDRERRCPRIGGPVSFAYCRRSGEGDGYCFKVLDCWWEIFDVERHLRETLSEVQLAALAAKRPKPKVTSLVEMIAAAQQRCKRD